jgi:hypothetical protein
LKKWHRVALSVVERLKERLAAAGHALTIERVTVDGDPRKMGMDIKYAAMPDIAPYEALVFASPVQAFSLCLPMASYMKQVGSLAGKQVACLVSQAFPYPWMGGNRAIRQMKAICRAKGTTVVGSGIVNWASSRRERTTKDAVETLSRAF